MPVVKRLTPKLLAEQIAGVQPMDEKVGEAFWKVEYVKDKIWKVGSIIHCFLNGWRIIIDEEGNDIPLLTKEGWDIMQTYPMDHHERFKKWFINEGIIDEGF